jgi:beta-galactosidase
VRPTWHIVDDAGKVWLSGVLSVRDIPRGKNIGLGAISVALSSLPAPGAYRLEVALTGTAVRNQWQIWVYPPSPVIASSDPPDNVVITTSWETAGKVLSAGGKVLLLSGNPDKPAPDLALSRTPIFWNRLMNPKRTWMLGLWVDARHAALSGYPTESYCDWQWVDMLGNTTAMNIESLPRALPPIVLPIDDWNRNLRLAMLFECAVGKGRLMVSAFDLSDKSVTNKPGAAIFRKSVLEYMAGPGFTPHAKIALSALEAWAPLRHVAPAMVISPPAPSDVADPG